MASLTSYHLLLTTKKWPCTIPSGHLPPTTQNDLIHYLHITYSPPQKDDLIHYFHTAVWLIGFADIDMLNVYIDNISTQYWKIDLFDNSHWTACPSNDLTNMLPLKLNLAILHPMLWSKPTNMCILFFHNLYFNIYFTIMQLIPSKVEESTVAFSFLGHGRVDSITQLACVAQSLSG